MSELTSLVISAAAAFGALYVAHKWADGSLAPPKWVNGKSLNSHESELLQDLIQVEDLRITFDDIGGLEKPKNLLQDEIRVFKYLQEKYHSGQTPLLTGLPVTVLVHGPPGTGKTMLAKATANELGVPLLRVQISTLQNKWYGESPKKVKAIFTLAKKIQPCVVLMDEIDALFSERSALDHAVNTHVKCEFMSQFDEFLTQNPFVFLIGVTNRPAALDDAIKRRLGTQVQVPLPTLEERKSILQIICQNFTVDQNLDWNALAHSTNRFSASDLSQLVTHAHKTALCQAMKQQKPSFELEEPLIQMSHFKSGLDFIKPSTTGAY